MRERCIDLALITDEDTVYYLTGYYDYLHMDFGRPTILLVHRQDETLRAQIGDSFILTEDGYETTTAHPKSLEDVIMH